MLKYARFALLTMASTLFVPGIALASAVPALDSNPACRGLRFQRAALEMVSEYWVGLGADEGIVGSKLAVASERERLVCGAHFDQLDKESRRVRRDYERRLDEEIVSSFGVREGLFGTGGLSDVAVLMNDMTIKFVATRLLACGGGVDQTNLKDYILGDNEHGIDVFGRVIPGLRPGEIVVASADENSRYYTPLSRCIPLEEPRGQGAGHSPLPSSLTSPPGFQTPLPGSLRGSGECYMKMSSQQDACSDGGYRPTFQPGAPLFLFPYSLAGSGTDGVSGRSFFRFDGEFGEDNRMMQSIELVGGGAVILFTVGGFVVGGASAAPLVAGAGPIAAVAALYNAIDGAQGAPQEAAATEARQAAARAAERAQANTANGEGADPGSESGESEDGEREKEKEKEKPSNPVNAQLCAASFSAASGSRPIFRSPLTGGPLGTLDAFQSCNNLDCVTESCEALGERLDCVFHPQMYVLEMCVGHLYEDNSGMSERALESAVCHRMKCFGGSRASLSASGGCGCGASDEKRSMIMRDPCLNKICDPWFSTSRFALRFSSMFAR